MQTQAVYERARQARDVRFDGRFFIGVKTTGIYCRPICPASMPKSVNVEFFATAAAASEAGFRPCLRCRPECAPGTPAWHGTSTTVRRGLRLIAGGALDDGNVEQLADRLGVTSRHLRRLFKRHLGASPLAVAHTQRLQFAKRLIDQTDLPLAEIAIAAGYGSVRRFNDAFKTTYGRAPRELRRAGRDREHAIDGSSLAVSIGYRRPFDWQGLLDFMSVRAIPGVESVADGVYRRTIVLADGAGVVETRNDESAGQLVVTTFGVPTTELFNVVHRLREQFDCDAPIDEIVRTLRADPTLDRALIRRPGIRVPGAWDGFELTVRAVLGQQISVKAATTLAGRIVARYGSPLDEAIADRFGGYGLTHLFPAPAALMRARFNGLGLVSSRAATIRQVARATAAGELDFDAAEDPGAVRSALAGIRGIGDWTVEYVAMRALKQPDAFPSSDLGLLRACDRPDGARLKPKELERRADAWRPWRAYAALLLWSTTPTAGG